MSLELSGTTGVKGVAGSVSAPSIVGDDTNTGISFPSADTIKFSTGGVERMQITNSGVTGTGIGAGKVLQQVQANYSTNTLSTTTSYANTGLTASITPSSSSNKILVIVSQCYRIYRGGATAAAGKIKIFREQSGVETAVSQPEDYLLYDEHGGTSSVYVYDIFTQIVQDSPNTTSAVSYKTKQGIYVSGSAIQTQYNGESYINLLEIAP